LVDRNFGGQEGQEGQEEITSTTAKNSIEDDSVETSDNNIPEDNLEGQAWKIFRELVENEGQSDSFTEAAILQERYQEELVSRLKISVNSASKIIDNMKLETVYLQDKGYAYREKGD